MDLKKEAARTAITFIKDKAIIGLGAGSTIHHLVDFLAEEIDKGLNVQLVTSSFTTQQLLLQKGLVVQPASSFDTIDIYFDGCDQLDKDLHALKCGGGIHTREKILASMATQFILVGDETKYAEALETKFPLAIEVLPESFRYVIKCMEKIFPSVKIAVRKSDKNDGPCITADGNYLLDAKFEAWPRLEQINPTIKAITGVVETSLFYNLAHTAIIATKEKIKILDK
ncbi:MAG TPA: ribose 5-phosphate isomerase A [Chitinophagaceae bacterium]|nr:ribose 5-phosphate isomerase A [Chitinophagaceae bacterium]